LGLLLFLPDSVNGLGRRFVFFGIFIRTREPLPVGTQLVLRFAPPTVEESFVLNGIVQWINPVRPLGENLNPGMGIRFDPVDLARVSSTATKRSVSFSLPSFS